MIKYAERIFSCEPMATTTTTTTITGVSDVTHTNYSADEKFDGEERTCI